MSVALISARSARATPPHLPDRTVEAFVAHGAHLSEAIVDLAGHVEGVSSALATQVRELGQVEQVAEHIEVEAQEIAAASRDSQSATAWARQELDGSFARMHGASGEVEVLQDAKPQGADPVWNAANCRNRRVFDDRVGLAAGRNSSGPLVQTYRRDMGGGNFVLMKDVSVPIRFRGRHWGGFRMGYRLPE